MLTCLYLYQCHSTFVIYLRLLQQFALFVSGWHFYRGISTMASLFSVTHLSASIISSSTRYFKGHFKVNILSELRWRTFVSAPLMSLSAPLVALIICPFLHDILGKLSSFTSTTSPITSCSLFLNFLWL